MFWVFALCKILLHVPLIISHIQVSFLGIVLLFMNVRMYRWRKNRGGALIWNSREWALNRKLTDSAGFFRSIPRYYSICSKMNVSCTNTSSLPLPPVIFVSYLFIHFIFLHSIMVNRWKQFLHSYYMLRRYRERIIFSTPVLVFVSKAVVC